MYLLHVCDAQRARVVCSYAAQARWARLVPGLEKRLGLRRDMDPCEVEGLWQLCTLEAGILGATDRACALLGAHARVYNWVTAVNKQTHVVANFATLPALHWRIMWCRYECTHVSMKARI